MKKSLMTIGITTSPSWITPIKEYIEHSNLPSDPSEATLAKKRANKYTIVRGTLYKICISTHLIRCLRKEEASYALIERG